MILFNLFTIKMFFFDKYMSIVQVIDHVVRSDHRHHDQYVQLAKLFGIIAKNDKRSYPLRHVFILKSPLERRRGNSRLWEQLIIVWYRYIGGSDCSPVDLPPM